MASSQNDGKTHIIYHLLMTNIAMVEMAEIDGLPSYKMVIFHCELLVITRWYIYLPSAKLT